jgi:hypothetical protein
MSSLRSRLEKTPDEEAPPKAIEADRRRPSYGEQATLTRTRDREIAKAANAIPPKTEHEKWQDHYWAKYKREEQAKKDAAIEKERQRQEALKQEQQRANAKALREFELTQCESVLIDATVEESAATAELVKRKYKDSIMDPTAWSIALQEIREKSRAHNEYCHMRQTDIDAMSDTELAAHLRCSTTLASALRRGYYID